MAEEGWLYVAVVVDLYSRMIVGWSMSERITSKLVIDALQMALWRRKMPQGILNSSIFWNHPCAANKNPNNIVEQDHRGIKRIVNQKMGLKSLAA